jgi:signal transduction histidine kinase
LIPEEHIDHVSMKQINVVNKACEQLTILLERQKAESSLKKQYRRLQKTLVELKTAREELAHKEKMAAIGTMAAGIAHEINNPLAYVISNVSSMDKYLDSILHLQTLQSELLASIDYQQDQHAAVLKESIHEYETKEDIPFVLEDIRAVVSDSFEGLQRVKTIISNLKSFTNESSTEPEKYDLKVFLEEVFQELRFLVGDHISFTCKVDKSAEFFGLRAQLAQVIKSLVNNSLYALNEGNTDSPTIILGGDVTANDVEIFLEDNGPGIDETIQGKIFDPFFTTKTVGDGTGLGLSVAHNIVSKLGGTISVTSTPNRSTRFSIRLPLTPS